MFKDLVLLKINKHIPVFTDSCLAEKKNNAHVLDIYH